MPQNAPLESFAAALTAAELEGFRQYADALPIYVWTQLPDGTIDWANRPWYEYFGLRPPLAKSSEGWAQIIHPDDLASADAAFDEATRRQATYEFELRVKPAQTGASEYRWLLARSTPQFDTHGAVVSWLCTGVDVHEARMRAVDRAALLAQITQAQAESFRVIADSVPQMMWSAQADGWIDWYNARWYEYTLQTPAEAAGWGWQAVHHPDDLPRVMEEWGRSIATGERFEIEFRLRGADGKFRMFLTRAIPVLDPSAAVTRWFGTNTDIDFEYNLRMRERRIAQTFQDAALQADLPFVPGLMFDAIYAPAQADALVGGDWYDVFRLIDGRIVVSVGDVAGSGLAAAVTMGSLRQSIRTASLINPDPIAVLDAVDRIVRDMDSDLFATAFVAVFDPIQRELRYASAGHPPTLLRTPTGDVRPLSCDAGLPLGLRQRDFEIAPYVTIEPGSMIVMYTDGLTEFERDPVAGEAKLIAAICALDNSARPAEDLYRAVIPDDGAHDDIAILTLAFSDEPDELERERGIYRWTFDATDVEAARHTRDVFARLLCKAGIPAPDVMNAELVFAELVGNVVRYASRTVRVALDFTADSPVLHVIDEGPGFEHNARLPSDMLSEHGRGLFIVLRLTKELSITRRTVGGSHMRAVLAGAFEMS